MRGTNNDYLNVMNWHLANITTEANEMYALGCKLLQAGNEALGEQLIDASQRLSCTAEAMSEKVYQDLDRQCDLAQLIENNS